MDMFSVLLARRMACPLPANAHLATPISSQPITDASDFSLPKVDVTVTDAEKCEVIVTTDNVITENNEPYNFRQSAGGATEHEEIVGGTVAWNQLVENGNFESTSGWQAIGGASIGTIQVESKKATLTIVTSNLSSGIYRPNSVGESIGNHVVLASTFFTSSASTHVACNINNSTDGSSISAETAISANVRTNVAQIWKVNSRTTVSGMYIYVNRSAELSAGATVVVENVQLIDLTLFNSAIADYVYSLEQSTAGAGVQWLKAHFPKLFDDGYKAYNAGELASVRTSAHEMVGFNQWDEQWELGGIDNSTGQNIPDSTIIRAKNYIPVLPNTEYFFRVGSTGSGYIRNAYFYDASHNFIERKNTSENAIFTAATNAQYMRFALRSTYGTTYNNDVCINISDPAKNDTYEAYVKHTYPLAPNDLRGIYKLDANNKLSCDGDEYRCVGEIKRRYKLVDLGTLTLSTDLVGFAQLNLPGIKTMETSAQKANILCPKYVTDTQANVYAKTTDKTISGATTETVRIYDTAFVGLTSAQVSTALSGVYLLYEVAEPYIEQASPFATNQSVDAYGTEEYIDTREVSLPVGHSTKYYNGKAYVKYFPKKTGVVEMADEGIMPMNPMYISANGSIEAEYWQ